MLKIYKKIIFGVVAILAIGFSFAQQQPAAFIVQVEPSSFDINV
jgi:hypothetical protein